MNNLSLSQTEHLLYKSKVVMLDYDKLQDCLEMEDTAKV